MRPFRELYMYLCVAQQGGGGGSTPPGHHLARRLLRIRHEKCVREKFLLSLFMIGISGALMCRCLSNIFVRFLFFLSHFIFTFFFRLVTTQPGGLTLRPQTLWHCCCHWHAVDIITNKLCVKDTFQRHVGSDAMIGSFRPLKGGYCGLFDFKIPCTNLNNCFEFKFNRD